MNILLQLFYKKLPECVTAEANGPVTAIYNIASQDQKEIVTLKWRREQSMYLSIPLSRIDQETQTRSD